jgi:hypothetical protein
LSSPSREHTEDEEYKFFNNVPTTKLFALPFPLIASSIKFPHTKRLFGNSLFLILTLDFRQLERLLSEKKTALGFENSNPFPQVAIMSSI